MSIWQVPERVGLMIILLSAAAPAAAQATRDSAGIRIVENDKPAWTSGRGWRLSEKPILRLGGGTSAHDRFGRIVGAGRLADGRIVVGDEATQQLRFYDASGRHLQSVRASDESSDTQANFHSIARLVGDSIAADSHGGSSIFAPDATLVRRVRFGPFDRGILQTPFVMPFGRVDNGTAVVGDFPQGTRAPAGARQWVDSASLFLVDRSGAVVRPLGKAPIVVFVAGSRHPIPLDFGPQATYASSGRSLYWGFPNEYAIRVYDSDWNLARIIRRAWTPRRFTNAEIDAYVDGWMRLWSNKTGVERDAERREMRAAAYPDFLPAYSAILATPSGELWVREPDLTGAPGCWCLAGLPTVPSRWSVFDSDGRWLGDVAMPARFVPLEIGSDYVLGRSREADEIPRVVMYWLERKE